MKAGLEVSVIAYAVALAASCGYAAVRGRPRSTLVAPAAIVLQTALVLQAVVDLLAVARGYNGAELSTHIGYLVTSLVVLPVTVASIRLDAGRWASAAFAIGCLVVAIVSIRLHQTAGVSHG